MFMKDIDLLQTLKIARICLILEVEGSRRPKELAEGVECAVHYGRRGCKFGSL